MTVTSTPERSRFIAAVWRRVCGVTLFVFSVGHAAVAVMVCLVINRSTASVERACPLRVQNNGSVMALPRRIDRLVPLRGAATSSPLFAVVHPNDDDSVD